VADETVSVRELRANLSRYLERANAGFTITVMRHGRRDCTLGPILTEGDDHDDD
jgi:prevent-host-death family protein